jgi:hypothetical protein
MLLESTSLLFLIIVMEKCFKKLILLCDFTNGRVESMLVDQKRHASERLVA